MNQDILTGKWKQIRGEAKKRWGKLTDSDLDRLQGRLEQLIGLVQERYGYSREQASKEVDRFLDGYNARLQSAKQSALTGAEQTLASYPWQALVAAFILGLVVGILLQPRDSG